MGLPAIKSRLFRCRFSAIGSQGRTWGHEFWASLWTVPTIWSYIFSGNICCWRFADFLNMWLPISTPSKIHRFISRAGACMWASTAGFAVRIGTNNNWWQRQRFFWVWTRASRWFGFWTCGISNRGAMLFVVIWESQSPLSFIGRYDQELLFREVDGLCTGWNRDDNLNFGSREVKRRIEPAGGKTYFSTNKVFYCNKFWGNCFSNGPQTMRFDSWPS